MKESLNNLRVGDGPYAMFFGLNLLGHGVCLVCCLIGFAIHQLLPLGCLPHTDGEETVEDPVTGSRVGRDGRPVEVKAVEMQLPPIAQA